ncbi:MAG: MtrB/PioB family decaheme-associated outer membrane protein [Halorhodospira halophila]|uniref:MtrB/PioB family decaheme-associated outer membrane protein n=1 Tax=Halorhodospira halophila TaxID=1053 RepID=UPI0026F039FF|nr:MtrB/PioB family decaheme-associated outer membrane protein [Halorhodospira halophila]MCC3751097.1 MtrB/PioB family decaheme-associated outer membrane protein [Halorhodospira halophila]
MKRLHHLGGTLAVSALAFHAAAGAGSPESSATFIGPDRSQVWVGLGYLSEDNDHFQRFTGPVEQGFYPHLELDLRYRGEGDDDARYGQWQSRHEGRGEELRTPALRGRYGVQGEYGTSLEYREMPRYYGSGLPSDFVDAGPDRLVDDGDGREWDVKQQRHRTRVGVHRVLTDEWKLNASFSREKKEGRKFSGQNGVYTFPAPVNQRTDQLRLGAEYAGEQLQGRVNYHLSMFDQLEGLHHEVGEDNIYARPPDNIYHQISAAGAYNLRPGTHFSADLQLGRAEQDERFVEDANDVGVSSLDGRIDTTRASLRGTHRFHPRLQVRGSYRYDDRDNRTPTYLDVDGENTRPHGWTRHIADFDADVRLPGRTNLVVGYEHRYTDRDLTESSTSDDTYRARLRSRITSQLEGSVHASRLYREGSVYEGVQSAEGQNAAEKGTILPAEVYHLAELEQTQVGFSGTYSVIPELALGAEVTYREDDFTESERGLLGREQVSYTLSLDYFPSEHWTGYGYVTWDDGERNVAGETRTLNQEEETWTLGLGTQAAVTDDQRWKVGMDALYAATDVDIGFTRGDGEPYPTATTRLTQLELFTKYEASEQFRYRLAYVGQRFEEDDWMLGFGEDDMGRENYDYTAHMVVGSVGYTF